MFKVNCCYYMLFKQKKKKKKHKSFLTSRISLAQLLCWPLVTCANTNKQTVTNEDKVTGTLNRQIIKGSFVSTQNNRHECGYKVDQRMEKELFLTVHTNHIWASKLECSFHVVHTHFSCKHSRAHKLIHISPAVAQDENLYDTPQRYSLKKKKHLGFSASRLFVTAVTTRCTSLL